MWLLGGFTGSVTSSRCVSGTVGEERDANAPLKLWILVASCCICINLKDAVEGLNSTLFCQSVETVRTDGTARRSFTGLFRRRLAFSLAVFESLFYWVDREGLWQVSQKHPDKKRFLSKAELPLLAVHHPLQQPRGISTSADMKAMSSLFLLASFILKV